jgi:transcriptional regulator with XRE-family HTH domain
MARGVNIEDWTTPEALDELRKIAKLTLKEIADYIGVSVSTLRRWRKQSQEFDEAIQQKVDVEERKRVQQALYEACFDRKVKIVTKKQVLDRAGEVHDLVEEKTTVLPADVRAQKFYLTNRHPARWQEKVTVEQEGSADVAAFIPVMDRMEVPQEGMSGDG